MAFLLDRKGQTRACIGLLVGNICFPVYMFFFSAPNEDLLLRPAEVKRKMVTLIVLLTLTSLVAMSFNTVFYSVHEDVASASQRVAANTQEKEAFFATITHEIRNPLQSLLGSVELMQEKVEPGTFVKLLEICKNCSELVLNLVSNILDMSKIAAGKMQLSLSLVDLREMIKKIMRISEARAAAKNVALRFLDDEQLPPALALDPQRLNQIILNIVSNAIKFTNHGEVVIKVGWAPLTDASTKAAVVKDALETSSWEEVMTFREAEHEELPHRLERYSVDCAASSRGRKVLAPDSARAPHHIRNETAGVVKIEVLDTGIGISKEGRSKLFKPYQQANASISQ